MNAEQLKYCYPRTRDFLLAAYADDAQLRKPVGLSHDHWVLDTAVGTMYYGSDRMIADLPKKFGLQDVTLLGHRNHFIHNLYQVADREIQTEFPLMTIPLNKPSRFYENARTRRKGLIDEIAQKIEDGANWLEVAGQYPDYHPSYLDKIKWELQRQGIVVPTGTDRKQYVHADWLTDQLQDATDPQQIAQLFELASYKYYISHHDGADATLISLLKLAEIVKAENNSHSTERIRIPYSKIAPELRKKGIAVGTVRLKKGDPNSRSYSFISRRQQPEGIEVIKDTCITRIPIAIEQTHQSEIIQQSALH